MNRLRIGLALGLLGSAVAFVAPPGRLRQPVGRGRASPIERPTSRTCSNPITPLAARAMTSRN
jgi:hypothetical protein